MDRSRFADLGVGFAALTAAVSLQPWPSGAVVATAIPLPLSPSSLATACALLALVGFLGRRFDWFDRRIVVAATVGGSAGAVAASLSVLVVLIDAGVSVPLWPLLAVVFGVMTGLLGIVDWTGLRSDELLDRLESVVVASFLTVGAVLAVVVLDTLGGPIATVLLAGDRPLGDAMARRIAGGAGLCLVMAAVLFAREQRLDAIDIRWLDTRELLYCVGGFIGLLLVLLVSAELLATLGAPSLRSDVVDGGVEPRAEVFLAVLVFSALLVGPAEELFFRNLLQKSLYASFTRPSAAVLSSLLYAAFYMPTYLAVGFSAALGGLTLAFVLSLVLAVTYARTDNVLVPACIHGSFNAFQYAVLYVAAVHDVALG